MIRQPTEQKIGYSDEERLTRLRRRMIRETEVFLNTRLYGAKGGLAGRRTGQRKA